MTTGGFDAMLNLDRPPRFCYSSFRAFLPREKHVDRVCPEDVLVMVYDGVLRFHEEGVLKEIRKGEYYIQRRGLHLEGRFASGEPKYYYVHFLGDWETSGHMLPLSGSADFTQLMPLFKHLDFLQAAMAPGIEMQTVLCQILSILNRQFTATESQRTVQRIISLVFQDLRHHHSLDDLAAMCGYRKNYVIRLFRQETGLTPHAYITRMKLDMARRLLAKSEMPVAQIGQTCGFGAYTIFYKEFVQQEGMPPLQWRKMQEQRAQ